MVDTQHVSDSGEPKKTKAELKAERRAKQEADRAAKAAKKADLGNKTSNTTKIQSNKMVDTQHVSDSGEPKKTKAELKAERRAKQEADRAAKAAKKADIGNKTSNTTKIQTDTAQNIKKAERQMEKENVHLDEQKKVPMFLHLHQYDNNSTLTKNLSFHGSTIHPAIIKLGLKYAQRVIVGSNARCVALVESLCSMIDDYTSPPNQELQRHFESKLKPAVCFLEQCRPKSISMGNTIEFLRYKIEHLDKNLPESQCKKILKDSLNKFVTVNVELAAAAISKSALTKISNGDNIMVYGGSSIVSRILCDAKDAGIDFTVVVVDARPRLGGKDMLTRLNKHGIQCRYLLITGASHVMPEVTKVLAGAHGIFNNGYVMGTVGLATLTLLAKAKNVPVIICCEAYKFSERVQTDSFINNELGDPRDILIPHNDHPPLLQTSWDSPHLKTVNLTYDVTPPEFISMVITELGFFPSLSAPAVIRMFNKNLFLNTV